MQLNTRNRHLPFIALIAFACLAPANADDEAVIKTSKWHGFDREHFEVAGQKAYVVLPRTVRTDNAWVWRARFPDFHFEMDVELLKQGFHVAYVDVSNLFGAPRAMEIGDAFYKHVTEQRKLNSKVVLEGVSRGGLFVYNWAARHPDRVAAIYCDTPVLDFKSWPAGKGQGIGSAPTWERCLAAWKLDEAQALEFTGNPIDHADVLVNKKIPLLHIVSESDTIVPPAENTYVLKQRVEAIGGSLEVISVEKGTDKSHGHHFTHPDPDRVVRFVVKHAPSLPKSTSTDKAEQ